MEARWRPKRETGLAANQTGINRKNATGAPCYSKYTTYFVGIQEANFALALGVI